MIQAVLAMATAAGLASCGAPLAPDTPPLLRDATARGGWWNGGCPPNDALETQLVNSGEEALSPQLMERLTREFPPGSDAALLERALAEQGFQFGPPCPNAPDIKGAWFGQSGGGFFGPYSMHAQIAWRQDDGGRLIWAKGTISFTGP